MSKYSPLQTHLQNLNYSSVAMTFAEIEKIIGDELPASSRAHRAWWSNNPTNNVMTKSWLNAGYVTGDVDLEAEKLVFTRAEKHVSKENKNPQSLFGYLQGTVTLPMDVDLTQPADPKWSQAYE